MAELKLRNEIGLNRALTVLEPGRRCVARCTWCYVEINRRAQWGGKARSDDDPGTFERLIEKSFGPAYDPTDILQWQLRNRVPIVWASGVEPFQDLAQARSILTICNQLNLPLFVQTRGTNWREVWDLVVDRASNIVFYVSIPSLDPRYVKRFEPLTPLLSEREALVRACADLGIAVQVAVAPAHPEWTIDLPGMVREFSSWGATDLFLDRLHLGREQANTIREHGGDRLLLDLAKRAWNDEVAAEWRAAAATCREEGMGFAVVGAEPSIHGIESFEGPDDFSYTDACEWPYEDTVYLAGLERTHASLGPDAGPLLLDWTDAVRMMEATGDRVDQVFSFRSMSGLRAVRDLPPAWKATLGSAAPFREYLRAIWNQPKLNSFPWYHPFVRYAVKPDGSPYRGTDRDLVMVYDPDWAGKHLARTLPSLDGLPWLTFPHERQR